MRETDTDRHKSRSGSDSERRKRDRDRTFRNARGRSDSASGRRGKHASDRKAKSNSDRQDRRKAREQDGEADTEFDTLHNDFLVNKESRAPEINRDAGKNAENTLEEAVKFGVEYLHEHLIVPDVGRAQRSIRKLKVELINSGSRFANMQLDFLRGVYSFGVTIDSAKKVRRDALLLALGIKSNTKNVFLELCNIAIPVPKAAEMDENAHKNAHKNAQNRNSDYGRAMQAAQDLGVKPEEFVHRLKLAGGIQAMAQVARDADRKRREEAKPDGLSSSFKVIGAEPDDVDDDDEHEDDDEAADKVLTRREQKALKGSRSMTRVGGRAPKLATKPVQASDSPSDDEDEDWTLVVPSNLARRLKREQGTFPGILKPDPDGYGETLMLVGFSHAPYPIGDDADDLLDEIVRAMAPETK